MIGINLDSGFVIYLMTMLVILLLGVGLELWKSQLHHWSISENELAHCRKCRNTFVLDRTAKVGRCPRCNSLCKVRQKS